MDGWMDGKMDGRKNGWMDGWIGRWMEEWVVGGSLQHCCSAPKCIKSKLNVSPQTYSRPDFFLGHGPGSILYRSGHPVQNEAVKYNIQGRQLRALCDA